MDEKVRQALSEISPEVRSVALATMAAWVSAIADRFTNPIAGMLAALDMLDQRRITDPVALDSLERVRMRLLGLGDFVSELVDFAKPARLSLGEVKLSNLLKSLETTIRPLLPMGAQFRLVIESGVESILGDPEKLHRVLRAILDNAVQAVPPAQVPVILVTLRSISEAGAISLTIEDNGPGFPPEVATTAMEPFVSTKEAGTGLGLAIAQKYIEAHQGYLKIRRSQHLGGALVEIALPLSPVRHLPLLP